MSERFQPPKHIRPDSLVNKLVYSVRLLVDFQFNTIHRHMRRFLPAASGKVMDVGAGESPFLHLLDKKSAHYIGLDVDNAASFGYDNKSIEHFDGAHIPYGDASVDNVICTEVLEHVEQPTQLIGEIHRVLRPGGSAVFTIPWSARFHYIPFDYHRFTPTSLRKLFSVFSSIRIEERGTDLTTISAKIVVAYAQLLVRDKKASLIVTTPLAIALLPILLVTVLVGHLSIILKIGSLDDPLGYTIWLRK